MLLENHALHHNLLGELHLLSVMSTNSTMSSPMLRQLLSAVNLTETFNQICGRS